MISYLSILAPRFDFKIIEVKSAKSMNEGTCQTAVGDQRDIEVYRSATNLVTVGKLVLGEVLGDVDHHIYLALMHKRESLRLLALVRGPIDHSVGNAVFGELAGRTTRDIELVAMLDKRARRIEKLGFLLGTTGRQ